MVQPLGLPRVTDEEGLPLPGLLVARRGPGRRFTAVGETDEAGCVRVDQDAAAGHRLVLTDALGLRPLRDLDAEPPGPRTPPRVLPIPRALASGWAVTDAQGRVQQCSQGNRVELLADEEIFAAVESAIERARSSIRLSQLLFQPDFVATFGTNPTPLAQRLVEAAERGVDVRLLLNENLIVPDDFDAMREIVERAHGSARVLAQPMSPNVFHAKVLVVDGEEAQLVGPIFTKDYWDEWRHGVDEPRRQGRLPHHDLALRIRGPAVAHVDAFFVRFWNRRVRQLGEGDLLQAAAPAPVEGPHTLQLTATVPAELAGDGRPEERGILQSYLRMLTNARDYVYLETQYFTSGTIVRAIRRALERTPTLQVILLMNAWTDVPTYVSWQKKRLEQLGHPDHPRLGAFTLWRPHPPHEPAELHPIYVHSKLAFADDVWATVGTANLDSASLETADEFGVPLQSNVDINAVLLDGVAGAPRTGTVAAMRRKLWAEHLGDHAGAWRPDRPQEGWLALWRQIAGENERRAQNGNGRLEGRILPYDPEADYVP